MSVSVPPQNDPPGAKEPPVTGNPAAGTSALSRWVKLPARILVPLEIALFLVLGGAAVYLWTEPGRADARLARASFPELLEASRKHTDNPRLFYYLGIRLHQLGHDGPAKAALERAAALDPDSEDTWLAWAAVSATFGQDEEPFGILANYLQGHPKSVRAHLALALLYQQVEAYASAYEEARKAAELDPKNTGAIRVAASSARELHKLGDAADLTDRLLAIEPNDWRNHFLRGEVLTAQNHYPEARAAYEKAVSLAPKEPQPLTALGESQLLLAGTEADVRAAAGTLEKSLTLQPRQARALRALGKVYLRLGDLKKADEALTLAARLDPRDEETPFVQKQVAERKGDAAAAARYAALHGKLLTARMERLRLYSAVWQDPKDLKKRLEYARFLVAQGDWTGAVDSYRRILNQTVIPDKAVEQAATAEVRPLLAAHPEALKARPLFLPMPASVQTNETPTPDLLKDAEGMRERGRYAEAEQAYRTVLARDPQMAEAWEGLGITLDSENKVDQAFDALNRAVTLDPTRHKAQHALAGLYYESGFPDEAARRMEKVVQQVPNEPKYWHALGQACLKEEAPERLRQGRDAFQKAVQLDPRNAIYPRDLASIELILQQSADAEKHYRQSLALDPNDVVTLQSLGDLLLGFNPTPDRLKEADDLLKKAVALAPKNPIVLSTLGGIRLAQEKPQEAVPYLEESVMQNSGDTTTWFRLARAYSKLGKKDRADYCLKAFTAIRDAKRKLSLAEERARMKLNDPTRRLELARLYVESGQSARAINQYRVTLKLDPTNGAAKKELDELTAKLKAEGKLPPMETFEGMIVASTAERGGQNAFQPAHVAPQAPASASPAPATAPSSARP